MAMLEGERVLGLGRTFPKSESGTKTAVVKPRLYSEKEIVSMMMTAPPELNRERRIETPVGTWSMDGNVTIFDALPETEISKITKVNTRRKLAKLATKILQMS